MAQPHRTPKQPNTKLNDFLVTYGVSRKALAHLVNQLASAEGHPTSYSHTSVGNWLAGMRPKDPTPRLITTALSHRIGRPVDPDEIGMGVAREADVRLGWDFPRDRTDAIRGVQHYWSTRNVKRRDFLSGGTFATAAYATPVTRWLALPSDTTAGQNAGRRVGRTDLADLWEAADQARQWDSKFGGGDWRSSSVSQCLTHKAIPLLDGTYSDDVGRELFSATAELARVVAWSAFDSGQHAIAQQHFIQALRLARAGGDIEMGAYVLTTMSLQSMLQGYPDEAVDMAQGAFERAKGHAAPRVLAFAKLAEARAHGRLGDTAAATAALGRSEDLLDQIRPGTNDPTWLDYFAEARLAADATEVFRDLGKPAVSLLWNQRAETMPSDRFARATGIRRAVVATSHLQARDLDSGLAAGREAADILARVTSSRATAYLAKITEALGPWKNEPDAREFIHLVGQLSLAAQA
ncbi:sporulation protein [Kitasatospora sp. GP82]|uniref:sporulation protein n=1 Tax=Kitasatospora sp. GP82 TaxID=3035089 RepID=UPI002474E5C5|nr:sporulation protein [Kitasatospora sp. GP82]MDH6130247.1 tetratricopeptide (TPR) repeat protein [Kitasatospora sp. GP82]